MERRYEGQPRVSVIITCYNHARFLAEAIESVRRQNYKSIEIIVVDDGSTDDSRRVAGSFEGIKYIYQQNAGLSAARNRGIDESSGSYLVFLDADDWLYEDAVETNISVLRKNRRCIFVSGGHQKVDEYGAWIDQHDDTSLPVEKDHYEHLLKGNYIGMHATVMYQRGLFSEFRFDTTLKACEDYDLYLRVARVYPICHHTKKIAAYRFHGSNMSGNCRLMMRHVLKVLEKQKTLLRNERERIAYRLGRKVWKDYYASQFYHQLWNAAQLKCWPSVSELWFLATTKPRKWGAYMIKKTGIEIRRGLQKKLPNIVLRTLHQAGVYTQYTPPPGNIKLGDFQRLTPFSSDFGYDRGGPVDRFYIEQFLSHNAAFVKGNVMEIGDNEYTVRFGKSAVLHSDILHVDSTNTKATYVGDISNIPQIPSEIFDCIIFTQTLHLIYDFKSALRTCYRILKPGGCLLLTVPGITPIDRGEWREYWLWSFTDTAMKKIMTETFNGSEVDVKSYGNVLVAAGFLYGMGLCEFPKEALQKNDPGYQVIISVKAIKH